MIGFESPFPVAVSQAGATEWQLTHELIYHHGDRVFTVPVGQCTDFASVPAAVTWLVPIETGIPGAVLHDYLWRVLVPDGGLTYREADAILREALGTLGVAPLRRWLMWAAVRWGSLTRPGGWRGWYRDAPRVLPLTVLALLFVAVPTVVTMPFLALYGFVEEIVSLFRKRSGVTR